MTLRKLGFTNKDQIALTDEKRSDTQSLLKEIRRLSDYLSLMTNEPSPPTEEDDTDATT